MTRRKNIGQRKVIFDLETGGRFASKHPIIQIGAVALDDKYEEVDTFEVKLQFKEADCDPEALKKVHYDPELWAKHAVEPITAHNRFEYFLKQHATVPNFSQAKKKTYYTAQLFAQNAAFDHDFLWNWQRKLKRAHGQNDVYLSAEWHVICTMQEALSLFNKFPEYPSPPAYNLEALSNHFQIPFNVNEAHDALYDSRKTGELLKALHEFELAAWATRLSGPLQHLLNAA